MKRFKKIYLLLGILAVVCAATIGVTQMEEHKEKIKNTDAVILSVPADSVQSLSWEYDSETFAFHRDEKWLYDADEAFPVEEEEINGMLEQFQEFGASFIIEEAKNLGQYGLDEPVCTIQLVTEEQSYEVQLGGYSSMDSQRYVSIGDGNVYLVRNDPLDYFDVDISDLIDHDELPSFEQTTGIGFAGTENYDITYEEDSSNTYCADDIYFISKDEKTLPLDTSRVEAYLQNISYLNLTDYVTYNVTDEELTAYGLDEPELTVTVAYLSEGESGEEISNTFVINISRSLEDRAADRETDEEEGDSEEDEVTAYVRIGASQIVYQISKDSYDSLMAVSYDSLRHQEVFSADTMDIRQIDITLEGIEYTITSKADDGDGGRIYDYQGKDVDMANFKASLKNLNAVSFTKDQPAQKEEIRLVVYLDNENFPKVEIALYRYDGDECVAVVDGEVVSFVRRSAVVDLIEAVYGIVLNE